MNNKDKINGFILEEVTQIPELNSTAYLFTHEKSQAKLIHLKNDDSNNLFSVAFKTPVPDDTGVPHILEHSVLAGSKKYPLKDPFQELLKSSLQTFLNALTYPDKTVYPVSSQVEKDFFNLVDVYCDAVFFPLLTQSTFKREGWHLESFSENGPITINGIVYNEMKGVFSEFSNHVKRRAISFLFPDTSYYYESGGDPEHIIKLTYNDFINFHKKYYHPSNAYFFLYGNIPSEKTLSFLDRNYLSLFTAVQNNLQIKFQPTWDTPRRTIIEAPSSEKDDGTASVVLLWKFGFSKDPIDTLTGIILYRYLLGTEGSPLKRALIDSGFGEDLDDISGFETEFCHGVFAVGLRKTKPELAEKIEEIVFETLKKEIQKGLDKELLKGSVRITEFRLREKSDVGRFPYNLILAERCYRSWLYDGNPLAHLAFEKPINFINDKCENAPEWFLDKIKSMLLENNHFLRLTVKASKEMGQKLSTLTKEQAENLSKNFTKEDIIKITQETKEFLEKQKTQNPKDVLALIPKLKKQDLPLKNQEVKSDLNQIGNVKVYLYPVFTSGIVYIDISFDCKHLPFELVKYLSIYSEILSRAGAAGFSYQEMSKRISLFTGGISCSVLCETSAQNQDDIIFRFFIHAKCLTSRLEETLLILKDLLLSPDFSNTKQIKDILLEMRNDLNASVIQEGHLFASMYAASNICKSSFIDETINGITMLRFVNKLIADNNINDISQKLYDIHKQIINAETCIIAITSGNPDYFKEGKELINSLPSFKTNVSYVPFKPTSVNNAIVINSSVNFVAKTWSLWKLNAREIGLLFLLSKYISTGYLWDKIRIQGGAYGGMAMFSFGLPVFSCASYRDPNIAETLYHFDNSLKTLITNEIDNDTLEQSIISTIGKLDTPYMPHQKCLKETIHLICGRTAAYRQELRDSILCASYINLKNIAEKIIDFNNNAISVLGNDSSIEKAGQQGIYLNKEHLL